MSDLASLSEALWIVRNLPAIVRRIENDAHADRRPYLWTRLDLDLRPLLYTLSRLTDRDYVIVVEEESGVADLVDPAGLDLPPGHDDRLRDRCLTPLATAIAGHWSIPTRHRALRDALRTLAAERGCRQDEVKVDAIRRAVLLALAERTTPAKIDVRPYIGARPDGAAVPADDVHVLDFLRWWWRRVDNLTKEYILTEAAGGAVPEMLPAPEPAGSPSDLDPRVDTIYAAARDDLDRRLLDAMAEHGSIADAARAVGITPAAARKRKERLLKRIG
jgi:hypothetical protein